MMSFYVKIVRNLLKIFHDKASYYFEKVSRYNDFKDLFSITLTVLGLHRERQHILQCSEEETSVCNVDLTVCLC